MYVQKNGGGKSEAKTFSVSDAHRILNKRQERKEDCFRRILHNSLTKIEKAVHAQQLGCAIEIPVFTFDGPMYELNEAIQYVMDKLLKNGFTVQYYFPHILFVSWDPEPVRQACSVPLVSGVKAIMGPAGPIICGPGQQLTDTHNPVTAPAKRGRGRPRKNPIQQHAPVAPGSASPSNKTTAATKPTMDLPQSNVTHQLTYNPHVEAPASPPVPLHVEQHVEQHVCTSTVAPNIDPQPTKEEIKEVILPPPIDEPLKKRGRGRPRKHPPPVTKNIAEFKPSCKFVLNM